MSSAQSHAQTLALALAKLDSDHVSEPNRGSFIRLFDLLASGDRGLIFEKEIEPVTNIPAEVDIARSVKTADPGAVLGETVMIKLNGGLGTSMGLKRAKSLLEVIYGLNFLDLTVLKLLQFRERYGVQLPLVLMDSYNTSADTLDYLRKYPLLSKQTLPVDFQQSREPKLRADTYQPVTFPADPSLEWCPPGHGDLYPTIFANGLLDQMLATGYRWAFISNADNLDGEVDPMIALYFAQSGWGFMNELTVKTEADVKGGHLVRRKSDGRLILREFSQIAEADRPEALDPKIHPYCNTNNVWVDLFQLKQVLESSGGVLDLPLIRNLKKLDPNDPDSEPVIQLETAVAAAGGAFSKSGCIEVSRQRFSPVKNQSDYQTLKSQAKLRLANILSQGA
jgi:UTP--glucose-1-phosphate uridylyltransferase